MFLIGVFNVLLKILEELKESVIFILVMIEFYKILVMIIL